MGVDPHMAAPKLPHFRQPPSLRGRAKSRRESSLLQPNAVEAYEAVRWPKGGVEGGIRM